MNYTSEELQDALRPIASLISKSEKAQQKLAPGTWQHTMLRDNIASLSIAVALMNENAVGTSSFTREHLEEALRSLTSMISRTENIRKTFSPGTSQHSLQKNRLKALRIAEALVEAALVNQGKRSQASPRC